MFPHPQLPAPGPGHALYPGKLPDTGHNCYLGMHHIDDALAKGGNLYLSAARSHSSRGAALHGPNVLMILRVRDAKITKVSDMQQTSI